MFIVLEFSVFMTVIANSSSLDVFTFNKLSI